MKQTGKMVIWPASLDSTKSRSQGRRLPKSQAVQTPRVDELEFAGRRLSLDPEVTTGSALPCRWWEKTGRLLVKRGDRSRSKVLRELAAQVARTRQAKQ